MEVVIAGYEGGTTSVEELSAREICWLSNWDAEKNERHAWYYGEHGDSSDMEEGLKMINALELL